MLIFFANYGVNYQNKKIEMIVFLAAKFYTFSLFKAKPPFHLNRHQLEQGVVFSVGKILEVLVFKLKGSY